MAGTGGSGVRLRAVIAGLALLLACLPAPAVAVASIDDTRHPLELRALVEPEVVLRQLPAEILAARKRGDEMTLARLYLARANACRVNADWTCQRQAGADATAAAGRAGDDILQVRGLIAEGRARISLQDYSRGEQLLGAAQILLRRTPMAELSADVYLAYSSLSYSLGKHALAVEYANRGLVQLGPGVALPMQVRLLRNRSRAEAYLGQVAAATASLDQAQALTLKVDDPKLVAELLLERARLAQAVGDVAVQQRSAAEVLQLAERLKNSQLAGLGHEALGVAALQAGRNDEGLRELRRAAQLFGAMGQAKDELRVLRALLRARTNTDEQLKRFLDLDDSVVQAERARASDDFDARVQYAERSADLKRLRLEAQHAGERERALHRINRLGFYLLLLGVAALLALAAFYLLQRRSNRRLASALQRQRESEARYRTLAENSSDLVVRMRTDGRRLYVSGSSLAMLGWAPEELTEARWDLVHPDDRGPLRSRLAALATEGGTAKTIYRARHRDGHYVWIEVIARLLPDGESGSPEIVYTGRDVSERVRIEQELERQRQFLRTITDNVPALIAYLDRDERFRFANAMYRQMSAVDPVTVLGRTMREVRGDEYYAQVKPQVDAALAGQAVTFDARQVVGGREYFFQAHYVPDFGDDGQVAGFFALVTDITALKQAEMELGRQASVDSLSGLANRRKFDEHLALALARSQRHLLPVALLYLDIDHFKAVNDTHGHAVGDAVIREFARRLVAQVRNVDLPARFGGDEFVVLLDEPASAAEVEMVARKLLTAMAAPFACDGLELAVGTSIGAAFFRSTPTPEALLAQADAALYAAKAAGRNTFRLLERE